MATGEIALPSFRHLLEHGPRPLALVTQPDKPVGRHQTLVPPEIKNVALAAGIPVLQPEKTGDAAEYLAALAPEVIIVMAYGQILRENILTLPSMAIINLHASLLPKYRGAACIQAAIDAGDPEAGVCSMHVVRQLDAGDVILSQSIPLAPDETGGSLHDRLAILAAEVMAETLDMLANGSAPRIPQDDSQSSYVPKLERGDGLLDWTLTADTLERRIRAYDPWPGTFTRITESGKDRRLKIFPPTTVLDVDLPAGTVSVMNGSLLVGCGGKALELHCVQAEGGKRMSAAEYLRGRCPERVY